jgi:sugar-specific transcriptional regulator TrmB
MQNKQLSAFGLTDKESQVYLALLDSGPANIYNLAKQTGVNRIALPEIVESLANNKLVSTNVKGKRKVYAAEPPEMIRNLLKDKLSLFEELLPALKQQMNKGEAKPKMEYYEGIEGIERVFRDSFASKDKVLLGFSGIGNLSNQKQGLMNFWDKEYIPKRKKLGLKAMLIIPDDAAGKAYKAKDKEHFRESRLVPASQYNFECEFHVWDNVTSFISYTTDEEFALKITSRPIANTIKMIWRIVWNQGY